MIHCRPRHTGLQTFRHSSSSRCSQMFALVGNSTEIFSGVKRYFSCWKNTPGCCPGWRRKRWCWCAYPSGCCCTSPLLVLLQEEEEEDKAFPTNRPAPHQHRNHLATSGPSCSPLFSRWSILGTPVVQYLDSPPTAGPDLFHQGGVLYFLLRWRRTGDVTLSAGHLDTWTPGHNPKSQSYRCMFNERTWAKSWYSTCSQVATSDTIRLKVEQEGVFPCLLSSQLCSSRKT